MPTLVPSKTTCRQRLLHCNCRPSLSDDRMSRPLFPSNPGCTINNIEEMCITASIPTMTVNRLPSGLTPRQRQRVRGFTLIELMTTILVLATILLLAIPGYRSFVNSNRLTAQANELVSDFSLARSEAGARSRLVQVCIPASATACATTGNDWAAGRIVWVDTNGNGSLDAPGEIIKYVAPLDGGVSMVASGPSSTSSLSFQPHGGVTGGSTWTFKLCLPSDAKGRQVVMPITGRPVASRIDNC